MWREAEDDEGALLAALSLTDRPSLLDGLLDEDKYEGCDVEVVAMNQVAQATRLAAKREAFGFLHNFDQVDNPHSVT